jgi:hypothetical protein
MSAPYSYSVSLRISHPRMDPSALTKSLRLKPSNSWKAGQRQQMPTGKSLKGVNRQSFWTARLVQKRFATTPRRSLEASLAAEVKRLHKHRALFRRIQRDGGRTELFIGIFGENGFNFGGELDTELLGGLTRLGLSLGLDIYP